VYEGGLVLHPRTDIVEIEKSGDIFRLLYDTKGRFVLHRLRHDSDEKTYKLARVNKDSVTANKVPYIVTHDGRTIRYADPLIKVRLSRAAVMEEPLGSP
jgi:ribosomal protein S4E